jgi:hypothetical protein
MRRWAYPLEKVEWKLLRAIERDPLTARETYLNEDDRISVIYSPLAFDFAEMCCSSFLRIPFLIRRHYFLCRLYCEWWLKFGLHHLDDLKQGLWPDGLGPRYAKQLNKYYDII